MGKIQSLICAIFGHEFLTQSDEVRLLDTDKNKEAFTMGKFEITHTCTRCGKKWTEDFITKIPNLNKNDYLSFRGISLTEIHSGSTTHPIQLEGMEEPFEPGLGDVVVYTRKIYDINSYIEEYLSDHPEIVNDFKNTVHKTWDTPSEAIGLCEVYEERTEYVFDGEEWLSLLQSNLDMAFKLYPDYQTGENNEGKGEYLYKISKQINENLGYKLEEDK